MKSVVLFIMILCLICFNFVKAEELNLVKFDPNKKISNQFYMYKLNNLQTLSLVTQGAELGSSATTKGDTIVKLKSPTLAFFIALGPGFAIHGAGHFYAGKYKTGLILLGTEILSGGIGFIGALGGAYGSAKGESVFWIGVGLFLAGWIYDFVASPNEVEKYNEEVLRRK